MWRNKEPGVERTLKRKIPMWRNNDPWNYQHGLSKLMQAHRDHHGPTCFPTSVVDLDLVGSGTFRPGRIQVRIQYFLTRLDPSSDPVLYDQVGSKSGSRIIVSDPNLLQPSQSSSSRPANHSQLLVGHPWALYNVQPATKLVVKLF